MGVHGLYDIRSLVEHGGSGWLEGCMHPTGGCGDACDKSVKVACAFDPMCRHTLCFGPWRRVWGRPVTGSRAWPPLICLTRNDKMADRVSRTCCGRLHAAWCSMRFRQHWKKCLFPVHRLRINKVTRAAGNSSWDNPRVIWSIMVKTAWKSDKK